MLKIDVSYSFSLCSTGFIVIYGARMLGIGFLSLDFWVVLKVVT